MQTLRLDWRFVSAVILLTASFSVHADPRIEQVWTCTLNDGNTVEELDAVHGKWVNWANKQSYGGDITGYVASAIVSSDLNAVIVIDSYPDFATYVADAENYINSAEGQALNDEYDAVSSCSANALYAVTESGSD